VPRLMGRLRVAVVTSLKDLAKKLQLSITQVSRALDDKPDVSAATKVKVRAAAKEMNYQPNAAARSLRKRKADTIAVVLPAGANHIGLSALLSMLFDTATALAEHGFDLVMLPGRPDGDELDALKRIVEGRRADALILVRTLRDDPRVAYLTDCGVPFVTSGRTNGHILHAYVDGDGAAGFAAATSFLAELGHKRIAHIGAQEHFNFAGLRHQGWLDGMRTHGLSTKGLDTAVAPNEAGGEAGATTLLASKVKPTALLCATDAMAIGAIRAVKAAGLKVGRDISVIGHDGVAAGLLTTPPLSTMEIDAADYGARIADKLIRRLGGADVRDLTEVLPIRQIPRASHGPPAK
jgi:LacI family transcriptional regulator